MNMENVVQRNFFRLLRSGAFAYIDDGVEPMSPWKWNVLYNISIMHGVAALVYDGMTRYEGDFFMQPPTELTAKWQKTATEIAENNNKCNESLAELFTILNHEQLRPILLRGQSLALLYDNPLSRTSGDIDIFFPYEAQAAKADKWAQTNGKGAARTDNGTMAYQWKGIDAENYRQAQRLADHFLNRKLQGIINKETRCCDSTYININGAKVEILPPTLNLLLILVRTARYILNEGISLKQLVDLGMVLRKAGQHVDFIKLQKWIEQLRLKRMAHLIGTMLVQFLKFDKDEIPFMSNQPNDNTGRIRKDIFNLTANHNEDWYFTQGKNIFVRASNSGAMSWQIKHLARFFPYYPAEALTSFARSFAHSLSHIEE